MLFTSAWCLSWQTRYANETSGNAYGSLAILNPLPPFGIAVAGHWSPVSMSPDGVCDLNLQVVGKTLRPIQSGRFLRYDQIVSEGANGKFLLLNGTRFAKCETTEQAERLAEMIRTLRREDEGTRERLLRQFVDARFSRPDAMAQLNEVIDLMAGIRWTAVVLFVFLFVLVPILVTAYGLTRLIIPIGVAMVLSASVISFSYFRAHKRLFPARQSERVSSVLKMVLFPPAAIRAGDLLALEALSRFHPLLIGDVLLNAAGREFYEPILRDLRNPLRHQHVEPDQLAVAYWHAKAEVSAIEALMRTKDGSIFEDCLAPPEWDGTSKTYCPRCVCRLSVPYGECPDCPGVSLVSFSSANRDEMADA